MFLLHLLLQIVSFIAILLLLFCLYIKWCHTYWARHNVPYIPPAFPQGNVDNPLTGRRAMGLSFCSLYNQIKSQNSKFAGIYSFTGPILLVVDPELIKLVLAKDFEHFMDRRFPHNEKNDPLMANLVTLQGEKWKRMRSKLSPTFTSGKMKMMFGIVVRCGEPMEEALRGYATRREAVEVKEIFSCFTTDVIGSCAFGVDINSFHNVNNDFRTYSTRALKPKGLDVLRVVLMQNFPAFCKSIGMKVTRRDVEDFFMKVVRQTIELRRNGFKRNDFMQLLYELMEGERGLELKEVAAQAFIFFLAGFDTSSTTAALCLLELAQNQRVQERLRVEIREVLGRHGGALTYESLQDMKYLTQVVDETLRMHPPFQFLGRRCTIPYKIPGTNVTLKENDRIVVSIQGLHHDEKYFRSPETFDPDRFSDENRQKIIPYTYLPFGEGPRICIGMRFGLMQTKIGLVAALKGHKYKINAKTVLPLQIDPRTIMLATIGGIWLDIEAAD